MKKQGFTLIEMIAVIGIIAVIAAVSLPAILNQLTEKKVMVSETTQKLPLRIEVVLIG